MAAVWVASVEHVAGDGGFEPSHVAVFAPYENDQLPIAVLPFEGRTRVEVEAYGALIAAAPLLREALQAALAGDNQWQEKALAALDAAKG